MTNVLRFPEMKLNKSESPIHEYQQPTEAEARQIDCLERINGRIETLRGDLRREQARLDVIICDMQHLLSSLTENA